MLVIARNGVVYTLVEKKHLLQIVSVAIQVTISRRVSQLQLRD